MMGMLWSLFHSCSTHPRKGNNSEMEGGKVRRRQGFWRELRVCKVDAGRRTRMDSGLRGFTQCCTDEESYFW